MANNALPLIFDSKFDETQPMDFQYSSLLIAAASLVTGIALCWLALRGRIAAAAAQGKTQARSAMQAELVTAQKRVQLLDGEQLLAIENFDKLNLQATQWREALDEARHAQTQLAERAVQVEILEAKLLALQEQEKASQQELKLLSTSDAESVESLKRVSARLAELEDEDAALERDFAAAPSSVTQLPVLETEVMALQSLAKTIHEEFLVLREVQRNFTAASSALQDVS